ncbi:hypothetical protein FQN49_000723 [Arthroderma sp. PD_2]|nr:hypothetical protein FQN49_000723 [Arthroderma sp. PD_2]
MASPVEQMEWEPTAPQQTLLPQQVLTAQRDRLVANTGRRIMGLTFPSTSSTHRPTLTRRILERSSPRRQWANILAGVDARYGETRMENGTVAGPSLPLNMESPPVTPRKRVIEEVDEPEKYEDHFSKPGEPKTSTSFPSVVESPNDISMEDVFTPPSASRTQPAGWPQANIQPAQEATFVRGSIGLRSPDGRTESHPNWFELRAQAERGVARDVIETVSDGPFRSTTASRKSKPRGFRWKFPSSANPRQLATVPAKITGGASRPVRPALPTTGDAGRSSITKLSSQRIFDGGGRNQRRHGEKDSDATSG